MTVTVENKEIVIRLSTLEAFQIHEEVGGNARSHGYPIDAEFEEIEPESGSMKLTDEFGNQTGGMEITLPKPKREKPVIPTSVIFTNEIRRIITGLLESAAIL